MKKNKSLKIVTTAALVASLATPFAAGTASAATYNGTNVVGVTAGQTAPQKLGKAYVEFNGSELSTNDYLLVTLPTDFKLGLTVGAQGNVNANGDIVTAANASTPDNVNISLAAGKNFLNSSYLSTGALGYEVLADNQIKLVFKNTAGATGTTGDEALGKFYINFNHVVVPSGAPAEVKATLEGKQGSAFNNGSVTIATASSSGTVSSSIDSVKSITSSIADVDQIRIKEDRAGSFKQGNVIKYKLPVGFKWQYKSGSTYTDIQGAATTLTSNNVSELNGGLSAGALTFHTTDEGRTLRVTNATGGSSTVASYIVLKNFAVAVSDETLAKSGDVSATVSTSGDVSSSTSDLLVARYGDYSSKVYGVTTKGVQAGLKDEKIGAFAIEESVKGSLQANRTITLTLSGNAKWGSLSDFRYDDAQSNHKDANVLNPGDAVRVGSDNKTIKLTVKNASSDALKAVLKDARINVSPDAEGDVKVTVGGSAGLTGEITVGTIVKPVTAKVDGTLPNIQIGQQAQPIGDVLLTEAKPEAIDHVTSTNDTVALIFPEGVTPTLPTSVTVTDGDLSIDSASVTRQFVNNKWQVQVNTRGLSSKASTLKFSGIKVTVDRTVPEGPISVGVGGDALVETASVFPGLDSVAKVDVANVGTPAAGKGSSSYVAFKLGATTYTVDGVEKTMDVSPFAENNRTFLPIRFAADALGATNVQWDQATKTVTVFKNGNIVQMVLGKKEYKLNGVSVPMDVAVKAKNGRVVLPIRFLGDALNVPVSYDEATGVIALGTPAVK